MEPIYIKILKKNALVN